VDWEDLFQLANRGGVAGMISKHLEYTSVPQTIQKKFSEISLTTQMLNRVFMNEAVELCSLAESSGLLLIPLKGAALNMGLPYDDYSLRDMCDLDLFARQDQLDEIEALLFKRGYQITINKEYASRHHHHLQYRKEMGWVSVFVDLHWTLLFRMFNQQNEEDLVIEQTRLHQFHGAYIRILSPELMILSLLIHLAWHRFRGKLKWLVDVAELARADSKKIQWDNVWSQAKSIGAYRSMCAATLLATELLEAPIPEPPKKPYLIFLLKYFIRSQQIIASKEQPMWIERMLINLLEQDSCTAGIRFLLHKGNELLERYWGIKKLFKHGFF
jgi:hypothetical protein